MDVEAEVTRQRCGRAWITDHSDHIRPWRLHTCPQCRVTGEQVFDPENQPIIAPGGTQRLRAGTNEENHLGRNH